MARRDVIVIGASAGGIEAVKQVLAGLPADLDAAVLVVIHMPPNGGRALGRIFERAGPLPASTAEDGEPVRPRRVFVAAADYHLLLIDGVLGLRRGPRENGHRPSIDALFRSAARYYGPRAIGVVLSGTLDDGTAGLHAIRRAGGVAVVQDPDDAAFPSMPRRAIDFGGADHIVAADGIGPLLAELSREEVEQDAPLLSALYEQEVKLMEAADDVMLDDAHPGVPSPWPCPDCNGVLWRIEDGDVLRFRCRVGHAWTAESLAAQQDADVETAMWIALRALEDRAALAQALAERAEQSGRRITAGRFREDLGELDRSIKLLRDLLDRQGSDMSADG